MSFVWQDLIDRARTYVDDDHNDTEGWIAPERWLMIGNVAYARRYKQWVRMGLISPAAVDQAFSHTASVVLPGVLSIVGVAEDLGNGYLRTLQPAQSRFGRAPFWQATNLGKAAYWEAHGTADSYTVTIQPPDIGSNYFARYIPTVAYATLTSATVDLPFGGDELLVLDMARKAHLKDSGASALLERLILEAEAEMNMSSFAKASEDSPRARSTPRYKNPAAVGFNMDPRFWRYV